MVDCGLGRIAIWRQLKRESADEIASILNEIFLERGPVEELLMDNATVFRSELLKTSHGVSDGSSGLRIVPAAMGSLRGTIEQLRL